MKHVVVIGGGTGTFTVLKGLRDLPNLSLSAIVSMADDGGSNKVLRDQFGLLPTSGVRQCIVALSKDETLLRELFSYRYSQGTGISGMTFGNLFMAALADICHSQRQAITETCKLLRVQGQILPVSYTPTTLLARYADGSEVLGEHHIDVSDPELGQQRLTELRPIPHITLDPAAKRAILAADLIVFGPGDLYTNSIANLVVTGMPEALKKSKGKLVFIMNLMTKLGETYRYRASDFLTDFAHYLKSRPLDYVILNTDTRFPPTVLKQYAAESAGPVVDDLIDSWQGARVIRAPLLSRLRVRLDAADPLFRSLVRHDSRKLASLLVKL